MFQKIFLSAIFAGLLSGVFISGIHQITTVPLIQQAEKYETGEIKKAAHRPHTTPQLILVHGTAHKDGADDNNSWAPKDGLERTGWTILTTVLTSIGFALLLTSGYALSKQTITGRQGVIWGIAGFAALILAPALGLPPELPGSYAAALTDRQIWWLGTALFTSAGIALMVFSNRAIYALIGICFILIPQALGAPHPDQFASPVPAELGGHFATASLTASFLLWTTLGWLSGTFYHHLEKQEKA